MVEVLSIIRKIISGLYYNSFDRNSFINFILCYDVVILNIIVSYFDGICNICFIISYCKCVFNVECFIDNLIIFLVDNVSILS